MKKLVFKNGDTMPALGLGTWQAPRGEVGQAVREAIRIGYRHIDCAAIYGNEKEIGEALQAAFKAGEVQREELWITSKLWNTRHGQANVRPALEKTLADLQLDYLDLYLIHWPVAMKHVVPHIPNQFIPLEEQPIADTWLGMEAVLDAGLTRHIGVSNFSVKKLKKLLETARHGVHAAGPARCPGTAGRRSQPAGQSNGHSHCGAKKMHPSTSRAGLGFGAGHFRHSKVNEPKAPG
jgi:alcohol dehydrogenase (NADP+)